MLTLNKKELRELCILACLNRDTKETSNFADSLTEDDMTHNFHINTEINISIPKRTLSKFTKYSLDWVDDNTLGIKLREEFKKRK